MAAIRIENEREDRRGWRFDVILDADGTEHQFDVRLSWEEYELWSHGASAPADVVRALFRFLLEREPVEDILDSFDAAVVRRYFPEVDKVLPGKI